MKTVSVIPIKLNNERLPGKNTKLLGDKPLIKYITSTLQLVNDIDNIYVYCSDDSICDYLSKRIKYLKRDARLDLNEANFTQIFDSFSKQINADIYVYAHATAPFITVDTINKCISKVKSDEYDSSFTATKIQDYLWQNGLPLNFDASNLPRSQDIVPIYRETSGIYVFNKSVFTKYKRRIGKNPYIKEVGIRESIDINTYEDFKFAELMLNNNI